MARYEFATHRLYVPAPLIPDAVVPLEPGAMNYLLNVLRMEEGARLLVFNGQDGEWEAELRKPTRKTAVLGLLRQTRLQEASGVIRYAFAPLKAARLDYLVQKAVEMGAAALTPVITQRTQVRGLRPEKMTANIIEAAEQCGVIAVPRLEAEQRLDVFLGSLPPGETLIFCDEDADIADPVSALRAVQPTAGITVLVGPEGGFTPEERAMVLKHPGVRRISLGPRILRADTAAVAILALVQAVHGDWRQVTVMEL